MCVYVDLTRFVKQNRASMQPLPIQIRLAGCLNFEYPGSICNPKILLRNIQLFHVKLEVKIFYVSLISCLYQVLT
jgi:hypothetical protein